MLQDEVIILFFHISIILCLFQMFFLRKNKRLNFETVAMAVAGWLFSNTALSLTASVVWGYIAASVAYAAVMYGGQALMSSFISNKNGVASSPTYASPQIQTQTNPDLPIPLLYGTVKLAGNRIWQNSSSSSKVKRIVSFAEGEICGFDDIRLNNIKADKVDGIKIEKFLGTNDQKLTTLAKLKDVGSLRNIAYLAITCNKTSKIDVNYNLTAIVKGRKVRVYTSPTEYEVIYSENPAWCLFDFLTAYNGLGLALDNECNVNDDLVTQYFDLNTFIEAAAYCDEQIKYTDNEGETKEYPRFTFNMVFDSQTSARDLIDEIYRSCRGGLFIQNGKLQLKIDKPEPISQVFMTEDIIKGSESFQLLPSEENYEILRCTYISPEHEWQKVEAFAELSEYRYGAPVEHNINLYSCTNFQQASRLAWYYINNKKLCQYFGSFQTDYRAYTLEVGDVIQIDSLLMGLEQYLVKVTSVSDNGSGVFTVSWRNYDERLYNDELGSKEPRVLVSNLSDIEAYPDDVQNFNVVQSQSLFNFVWDFNEDETNVYEIRMGDSWDTANIIAKELKTNTYTTAIAGTGLYRFWIKAFNQYNYSENATMDVLQIDNIPNMNEIITIDVLSNVHGKYDGTYITQGTLKLMSDNVLWHNTADNWGDGDTYYQTNGLWGTLIRDVGTFTSAIFDIGAQLQSTVTYNYDYITDSVNSNVRIEYRTSIDKVNWSDWALFTSGIMNFRFIQFKIQLSSQDRIPVYFKNFSVSVDMPDIVQNIETEVIDAVNGCTVSYDFTSIPSIVATVQDSIAKYAVVPQEFKNSKNAKIYIYDNNGELTTGKLSLILKGY